MKKLIGSDIGNYFFDPLNKTISILDMPKILNLENILVITNITAGIIIFNFANPSLGGAINNNTLSLIYNTNSMYSSDRLQIFIDYPEEMSNDEVILQNGADLVQVLGDKGIVLPQNESTGELFTYAQNVENIFGSQSLTDGQNVLSRIAYKNSRVKGRIGSSNESIGIDCTEYSSVTIQLSGTWAGTVTFEANVDGGNFQAINGLLLSGNAYVTTATANGIYRFNTAGLVRVQARFSTYTSGTIFVTLMADGSDFSIPASSVTAQGSQAQNLVQRASTYELNTYDTNLAASQRSGFAALDPIVAPTVNPALPAAYADNRYAKYPQLFPRLRVESGGDQKLPFAQEQNTNRLLVATPELLSLLEQVLIQLKIQNQNFAIVNGLQTFSEEIF